MGNTKCQYNHQNSTNLENINLITKVKSVLGATYPTKYDSEQAEAIMSNLHRVLQEASSYVIPPALRIYAEGPILYFCCSSREQLKFVKHELVEVLKTKKRYMYILYMHTYRKQVSLVSNLHAKSQELVFFLKLHAPCISSAGAKVGITPDVQNLPCHKYKTVIHLIKWENKTKRKVTYAIFLAVLYLTLAMKQQEQFHYKRQEICMRIQKNSSAC